MQIAPVCRQIIYKSKKPDTVSKKGECSFISKGISFYGYNHTDKNFYYHPNIKISPIETLNSPAISKKHFYYSFFNTLKAANYNQISYENVPKGIILLGENKKDKDKIKSWISSFGSNQPFNLNYIKIELDDDLENNFNKIKDTLLKARKNHLDNKQYSLIELENYSQILKKAPNDEKTRIFLSKLNCLIEQANENYSSFLIDMENSSSIPDFMKTSNRFQTIINCDFNLSGDDFIDSPENTKSPSLLSRANALKAEIELDKFMEQIYFMYQTAQQFDSNLDVYQIIKDFTKCNSILLYSLKDDTKDILSNIKNENPNSNIITLKSTIDENDFKDALFDVVDLAENYYNETKGHTSLYIANCERFLYKNSPCLNDFKNFVSNCSKNYHITIFLGTNNLDLIDETIFNKKYISSRIYTQKGDKKTKTKDAIKFMEQMNVERNAIDTIIQKYFSSKDEIITFDNLKAAIVEAKNQNPNDEPLISSYISELEKRKTKSTHIDDDIYLITTESMFSNYGI